MDKILVLDFGGQYNQLIARRVRDQQVYAEIKSWQQITPEKIWEERYKGIIFTGGPNSVYDPSSPHYDPAVLDLGIPILGICYGDQLLPRVGIELPISETAAYFLFYGIYLVIQFLLFWRFRNRLEVTYATAYDTLRPQPAGSGVVLGNIFDLAKNAPPEL